MSVHASLTLPDVICKLGRQLAGAETCLAVDEAISPLDKVRLAAFTGDVSAISCRPPLLGTDSMIPGDLFLYSKDCPSRLLQGPHNIHQVRGLHVVGGAMMQTKTCKFPVAILYSDIKSGLVLHAGDVPIAKLEAEFCDDAFCETDPWAKYVMGSEANEFAQWKREAATGLRTAGLGGTPRHLVGDDCYRLVRHGVTAFLSLRSPENEAEFSLVKDRLIHDLAVLPKGTRDLMKTYSQHKNIMMAFVGSSDKRLPHKDEIVEASLADRAGWADTLLDNNPVMSWISSIIIHCAYDDAFDRQGEPIAECNSGLRFMPTTDRAVDDCKSNECSFLVCARGHKSTDIDMREVTDATPFTLTEVMRGTNRVYATKTICDLTGTSSKVVMETVSSAIFENEDIRLLAESCSTNCTANMTPITAMSVLGKCLVDHQALVIVARDPDGRITNAKLVGFQTVVPNLNMDSLARMMLFPWVTVLFVDKESVSMLLLKDPESVSMLHMESTMFSREPLKMRESAKPRGAASDDTLQKTMEQLKHEVVSLKTESNAANTAIREFEKKLNFLVEKKAIGQVDVPDTISAPVPEESEVIKSLKRTLTTLVSFAAKRPCA